MILIRDTLIKEGIFGRLMSDRDEEICKTLERAYPDFGGKFKPKIPPGNYMCVKGIHQLSGGVPFETFEVTGVEGHWGLLFHPGNRNGDSDGCILLGEEIKGHLLCRSRVAFMTVMVRMMYVESFALQVIGG